MQSTEQSLLSQRTARDLVLLIVLTFAVHLPFIGQAFHLDDVQYLDVARNVFRNPVFPLDLQSVFEGKHVTLWAHSHPPLNSYVIAGLLLLSNRTPSEKFLHTCFLIFPALTGITFYFLAPPEFPSNFPARQLVSGRLLARAFWTPIPFLWSAPTH